MKKNENRTIKWTGSAIIVLLLIIQINAWTIDGDSVYEENQYAKITVTPHTIFLGKKATQDFTLKSKIAQQSKICIAYVFNYNLKEKTIEIKNTINDTHWEYQNKNSYMSYRENQGKHIYYTTNPVTIEANGEKDWRVTYTPNPLDTTKKWGKKQHKTSH